MRGNTLHGPEKLAAARAVEPEAGSHVDEDTGWDQKGQEGHRGPIRQKPEPGGQEDGRHDTRGRRTGPHGAHDVTEGHVDQAARNRDDGVQEKQIASRVRPGDRLDASEPHSHDDGGDEDPAAPHSPPHHPVRAARSLVDPAGGIRQRLDHTDQAEDADDAYGARPLLSEDADHEGVGQHGQAGHDREGDHGHHPDHPQVHPTHAAEITLKRGEGGKDDPANGSDDLADGKEHQLIGAVVQPETRGAHDPTDQQVVGAARPVVHQIEAGQVQAISDQLPDRLGREMKPRPPRDEPPDEGRFEDGCRQPSGDETPHTGSRPRQADRRRPTDHERRNLELRQALEVHSSLKQGLRGGRHRPQHEHGREARQHRRDRRLAEEPAHEGSGRYREDRQYDAQPEARPEAPRHVSLTELLPLHESGPEAEVAHKRHEPGNHGRHPDDAERFRGEEPDEDDADPEPEDLL